MGRRDVGRRTIKRAPAGRLLDGKGFRLADEVRYIQDKAADHDGRMVTIGQLILFSTDTGDAWLLDVTITLLRVWPETAIPKPSIRRKPIPASQSNGRAAIALKDLLSSTLIATPAGSPPFSATLRKRSLKCADLKISNMFG